MPLAQPKENPQFAPRTPTTVTPATPIPAIDPHEPPVPIVPPQPTLPPHSTGGSSFLYGEAQSVLIPNSRNVIDFGIPALLFKRKVYGYLWVNPSNAADYAAKCEVEFWRNWSKVGSLWLSAGLSSVAGTITETVATALVTGGNVVQDSIGIYLAQPTGTQPTSGIVLQAQNVLIESDRVTVSTSNFVNVTGVRLWLGVISSGIESGFTK